MDEDVGVIFARTDLPGAPEIPATIDHAVERHRRTALARGTAHVELTEHVLAALFGLSVDNCLVELDGPEPPGGDGSCRHFVEAILEAGIIDQEQPAAVFEIPHALEVVDGPARIIAEPHQSPLAGLMRRRRGAEQNAPRYPLGIRYELDYGPDSPIEQQSAEYNLDPETFPVEIAGARTFVLESEIAALRAAGYGEKVTEKDLLVFGESGVISQSLRADNECARHKLLDCLGDFALVGSRLVGRVSAVRSGHALNRRFIRQLAGMAGKRRAA